MQKINYPHLDGLRGVAILSVILCHMLDSSFGTNSLAWNGLIRSFDVSPSFLLLYPTTYGWAGVSLFFVISGFVIHVSRQQSESWTHFFIKRFFRIFPPYAAAVLIFSFIWPWGSLSIDKGKTQSLISHILLIHNFSDTFFYGINPSFWSIAVEAQLYLIFPLLYIASQRFGWGRTLAIVASIEVLLRAYYSYALVTTHSAPPRFLTDSPFAYWFSWGIGAYLADMYRTGKKTFLGKLRLDILLLICLLLPLSKITTSFSFIGVAILSASVIERMLTRSSDSRSFENFTAWRWLTYLGTISYSLYLIHQPILNLSTSVARKLTSYIGATAQQSPELAYLICIAMLPVIFALAHAFKLVAEEPSAKFGRSLSISIGKRASSTA